jgi:hypothetical protein
MQKWLIYIFQFNMKYSMDNYQNIKVLVNGIFAIYNV